MASFCSVLRRAGLVAALLVLCVAPAAVVPGVCAASSPAFTASENASTLAFLRGFVAPGSALEGSWTGTDFCGWTHVHCDMFGVRLDLASAPLTTPLVLPELAEGVDGAAVLVVSIKCAGLGEGVSGPLPESWGRLTRVTEMDLSGNRLSGTLPVAWRGLTALTSLALHDNTLDGGLPAEWEALVAMDTLLLHRNALTGPLPPSWSALAALWSLDLSGNQLDGSLPMSWGYLSMLRYVSVAGNKLSGSIPASYGLLNVFSVDISNNQFCGCVSSWWNSSTSVTLTADPPMRAWNCMKVNACPVDESSSAAERATLAFLQGLAVSMPSLQSTWTDTRYCAWPGVMCYMNSSVALDFADVALTAAGSLPELRDSVNGSLIPLLRVQISGKAAMVSGSLPVSWSRLTQLTEVTLTGNALTGPLPAVWSSLKGLRSLNLGNNALSGALPAEWGSSALLRTLSLQANSLTGALPVEWGTMAVINTLNLADNQLSGSLPVQWRNMSRLRTLNVGGNRLSGSIPTEFGEIDLNYATVSGNQLCGCVPRGWYWATVTADAAMRSSNCLRVNACAMGDSADPAERATLEFLQSFATASADVRRLWNDTRYCAWTGVTCNTGGSVVVDMAALTLTTSMSLPALSDSVNGSLILLTQMRIIGKGAMVSGSLPASWGRLTQLTEVNLEGNALSGTLPADWATLQAVSTMNVQGNALSGTLPADWSSLKALRRLDISRNQLIGSLPASWGSLQLRNLYINHNQLSGSAVAALAPQNFNEVNMQENQFCGCLPAAWRGSYSPRVSADAAVRGANCASANACSVGADSAPEEQEMLRFLTSVAAAVPALQTTWTGTTYCAWPGVSCSDTNVILDFSDTALTTPMTLPEVHDDLNSSLLRVTQIRVVNKSAMVTGTLPSSWGKLLQLRQVQVQGNALSGTLPKSWGALEDMTAMNISRNDLSGTLPAEWAALSNLDSLAMSNNRLSGSIASAFSNMRPSHVDVSRNFFCGCVPSRWTGYSTTLIADIALRAANCTTANACAVDASSGDEERHTLRFLQSIAGTSPTLRSTWTGTRYCAWRGVACSGNSVVVDLSQLPLAGTLTLPELDPLVDGSLVAVTQLRIGNVSAAALAGTLPESWGRLTRMVEVHLYGGGLTGTVPATWCGMTSLTTLNLFGNQLTGVLPADWQSLAALALLNVSSNALSGAVPVEWRALSAMQTLDVSRNALSGTLPSDWAGMTALRTLNLSHNRFSDTLPASWSALASLRSFSVQQNSLTGSIPTELGNVRISTIDLSGNFFCGCVPSRWLDTFYTAITADAPLVARDCATSNACGIGESPTFSGAATHRFLQQFTRTMGGLESLWVGPNYCAWRGVTCGTGSVTVDLAAVPASTPLTLPELADDINGSLVAVTELQAVNLGAMMTGVLPESWMRLTQLRSLDLRGNSLSGTLPATWAVMPALTSLLLSSNRLTGTLPAAWSSMASLKTLAVNGNMLSGSLPMQWRDMQSLDTLDAGSNTLTGTLPAEWGSLPALRTLVLGLNTLNGTLPAEWSGMHQLSKAVLYFNKLSGSLPDAWGTLPALSSVYLNGNGLCGCVPATWRSNPAMSSLYAGDAVAGNDCASANVCADTAPPPPSSAAPTEAPTTDRRSRRDLTALWIVLGAIGGGLVAAVVVLSVLWCRHRRSEAAAAKTKSEETGTEPYTNPHEPLPRQSTTSI
ncbi:Leucine rich repeat protein [Novymonas esmeraldas]|uniref:Leucine rich repeat protein n=1 Tax=Novymonas esmeraldas TaxID=1808958 RepID=A0AAW0EYH5_9TRYP